uniref:WD_REPEATS_REGION domain-containing protein n=1 Tax=Toxocara canis TaxID=6265 RepID=A0A183U4R4_TOXCA
LQVGINCGDGLRWVKISIRHLTPLAVSSELRQGVVCMHLQEALGRLVTVGFDRVIMIWDVKQLVQ